jgi:hypothetical protein
MEAGCSYSIDSLILALVTDKNGQIPGYDALLFSPEIKVVSQS